VSLLASDGVESIVLCEPLTGRTHQIRLHLQWAGFPIANDPLYGPQGVGSTAPGLPPHDPESPTVDEGGLDAVEGGLGVDAQRKRAGEGGDDSNDVVRKRGRHAGLNGVVWEDGARDDPALGLEANGWADADCVHCEQSRKEGCRGYFVPAKRKAGRPHRFLSLLHQRVCKSQRLCSVDNDDFSFPISATVLCNIYEM
jgi:hypothetical protein